MLVEKRFCVRDVLRKNNIRTKLWNPQCTKAQYNTSMNIVKYTGYVCMYVHVGGAVHVCTCRGCYVSVVLLVWSVLIAEEWN